MLVKDFLTLVNIWQSYRQNGWLSYTPFALHFCPQRCRSRQISWITCVLQTETVIKRCYMLIGRLVWVNCQEISNCYRPVLTYWQTDAISDWPTADHVRHFAATAFLCCGSSVQWVMGFFIQGGPKKPDCFSDLITLWRLVLERRAVCQNCQNFIKKKGTKLAFQWV